MNDRMQPQPTALMMAVGQPNIKSYASPSITPSNNYRAGYHQAQQNKVKAEFNGPSSIGNTSLDAGIATHTQGGSSSLRHNTGISGSNIQGRRIDSPDLKVAVNREIEQQQRPHTAGHPFSQQFSQAHGKMAGKNFARKDEYMTIINNHQQKLPHNYSLPESGHGSANNTMTLSNNLNLTTHNNTKRAAQQMSTSHHNNNNQHFEFNIKNQRGNQTIQYDENPASNKYTGRKMKVPASKSQNPHGQKRKKQQQSRSAPKYGPGSANNQYNIMAMKSVVSAAPQQQLINIQISNAKMSGGQKPTGQSNHFIPLRKRPDPTKFHSQGGIAAGQMSAPVKSKSRSRSQKRKQELNKPIVYHPPKTTNQSMSNPKGLFSVKPPKQPGSLLNKSSINPPPRQAAPTGAIQPFDIGFSFENKENQSINYDEFSPSRITDGPPIMTGGARRSGSKRINVPGNFLDSDSSLSSPKPNNYQNHHSQPVAGVTSSGPHTGKSYFMDKSSFLKHFSPERPSDVSTTQHKNNHNTGGLSSSEREKKQKINDNTEAETNINNNSSKAIGGTTVVAGSHRIHLKVVDKMMKEKFKHMKAKDDAEDLSRRKFHEDQLIIKHLQKKAEQQASQRAINEAKKKHRHKGSQVNCNAQRVGIQYKKQRSKSCMNKTDNIFCGLPRSKERQQIIQQFQLQNQQQYKQEQPPKQVPEPPAQPKQPTQAKRNRDKSSIIEMKELKRLCLEELKRDLLAGKVDGLPTTSNAAFASNKRQSNLNTITHKKGDTKQNQSQNTNNQASKGDLNISQQQQQQQKRKNSKGREGQNVSNSQGSIINPALASKIKKFIQLKKKSGFIPKSLEQTILNEKKLKIQENLNQLSKNIKNKQSQHLRQHSYNFLLKKQQAVQYQQVHQQHADNVRLVEVSNSSNVQPQKKLKPQFFNNKKKDVQGVFNYQGETMFEHENSDGGRGESNSLTPVRASRKSNIRDNDISLDCQEDYQKLLNSIHYRHKLQHGQDHHHISNSNPPVQNRRRDAQQNDSLSIEASRYAHRDSSQKNERRRLHENNAAKSKPLKDKRLIDELEYRHKKQKQILQRTLVHDHISGQSSEGKKYRSSSSPNTLPAAGHNQHNTTSIVPSHSDITTLVQYHGGRSTDQKKFGKSDEGSVSNHLSASNYEHREKIQRKLTSEYGPHIQQLKQMSMGGKKVKISHTQLLVTLHSAAIVIQSQIRKHLNRRGFYNDNSNKYVDSDDEGFEETKTEIIKQTPVQTLMAQMSPLRQKQKPQTMEKPCEVVGNQFYAPSANEKEKVVVCSVITSARPVDQSTSIVNQTASAQADESNLNSLKTTQNYVPLRYKPSPIPKELQAHSVLTSAQSSVLNTAIKTTTNPFHQESTKIQIVSHSPQREVVSQFDKDHEGDHQELQNSNQKQGESSNKELGQDSGSRKNLVPSLNLSSIMNQPSCQQNKEEKKEEPKAVATEAKPLDSSARKRLFDRHPFQDFQEQHQQQNFDLENYPEMLKLRELAIQMKEKTEKKLLKQMHKSNQLSPRTYEKKRRDLEIWVTKEQEEVKRTRKVFEEEWHKTQNIIKLTQKDQENMKRLMGDQAPSTHRSKYLEPLNQVDDSQPSYRHRGDSYRVHSSRPEHKSFLDSLQQIGEQQQQNQANPIQQLAIQVESSRKTQSKQSNFEQIASIETPPENKYQQPPIINKALTHPIVEVIEPLKVILQESQGTQSQQSLQDSVSENLQHKQDEEDQLVNQKQSYQDELKRRQLDLQFLNDHLRNEDIDIDSDRIINFRPQFNNQGVGSKIKEVDQMSQEEDGTGFNGNNDTGMQKGLSRTKNSLQLHTLNRGDEEEEESEPSERPMNEEVPKELIPEEDGEPINSDFRRNILDVSHDGDNNGLEQQVPVSAPMSNQSPNLKEHLHRDNFFIENFDLATPQTIIDQIKPQRQSPPHEIVGQLNLEKSKDQRKEQYKIPNDEQSEELAVYSESSSAEKPPQPPSQKSSELIQHRPRTIETNVVPMRPMELEEIDIQIPVSPNALSNAPVSPAASDNVISGGQATGNLDTKILIGGGSLNSTLSAGENGNQDLVRIIHEVQEAQNQEERQPDEINKDSNSEKAVDQITEDIYSKIMEELKLDMEVLLLNDPRIGNLVKPESSQNKQQFSESGRFLIFDRRGIQTDLFAIERYVEEIYQEVHCDRERFLQNIMDPISRNPREVLNQLQNSEIGSYEHFEQHFPSVLPLETYLKLERRRKDMRTAQQEGNTDLQSTQVMETKNFLAECEHIHNKVLFDCINDSLLQFKPYAKDGSPLPWSRQNRRLKPIEDFTIEEMFEIVKHDLFRWAIMQAGTLPRREFVFGGLFDEELFAEIREKKLATLLAREMIENEPKWLNYEFEEAQVKIDIGDMILEQLVTETITILNERMGGS